MIDTHCHLLPRLDDGPRTDADAVRLARVLVEQGVRSVLCTPHFSAAFPTVHSEAVERVKTLRRRLESAEVELEISVAAEIGPTAALTAPMPEILDRTVHGRFAIVEVLGDSSESSLAAIIERLAAEDLRAVLAHPERSRAVHRDPRFLDSFRSDGALIQIVAPSLLGRWGRETEAAAWRLVDTGRADLLASDAHGARRRRPHLRRVCELIAARLGRPLVDELTLTKPRLLWDGTRTGMVG